eukprot:TRINITY_DN14972_c0_g1_i1.p1 TRINITY_DN14972_c0_g1~~TRINITY_DN14972_c0_g1_i1.p1  ORF type:complete len:188 (+),score=56.48 TRINITY_DN14972_c0_g1_i1:67-630(+)
MRFSSFTRRLKTPSGRGNMSDVRSRKGGKKTVKAVGPRQWAFDGEGNILGFSFKALRADVLVRLKTDNLYTLEECKVMIKEMLKYSTAWCEVELAQLMYLSNLHRKLIPDASLHLNYQWPITTAPVLPFDFAHDLPTTNPRFRIGKLVEELNKSLIRLADQLLMQRKERLLFAARLLEDLEAVEELR